MPYISPCPCPIVPGSCPCAISPRLVVLLASFSCKVLVLLLICALQVLALVLVTKVLDFSSVTGCISTKLSKDIHQLSGYRYKDSQGHGVIGRSHAASTMEMLCTRVSS